MKAILRPKTRPAAVAAFTALTLTVLLYGDAISLPLFSDDLVQIPWLESITWRDLWSTPSPYGYYRPLWYTLWRLWGGLTGGLHPLGLHLLNLIAHFAAAWLAGLWAANWVRPGPDSESRAVPACLATALFAAFPFSRQAVAWPGAVYNPLVSAMAAGALLAYDQGHRGRGRGWIGLAILLAAMAPFTYEAGLLVAPLILLSEGVNWVYRRWPRRPSWWPLACAGLFVVTFVIWRAMRGTGVTTFGLNFPDVRRNAGYLAQGLIYPIAPLAQRLAAAAGLDPELSLWLIGLPALTLLVWSGLRWHPEAFWIGAAWFALFALPPLVSMKAEWFALAPRFLYMTAAGGALMWTAALTGWLTRLRFSWQAPAAAILLAALLAPAVLFVRDGMHLYHMAGTPIRQAAEAAVSEPDLLLVNLPMQITPRQRIYPLGFEGITPLPARVTSEGLIYVHTGIHAAAEAVAFGVAAVDEPAGYTYQTFGRAVGWEELAAAVRRPRAVYLTRYEPERIRLVVAGGAVGQAAGIGQALAHFGERVALLQATGSCNEAGQIHLTLYWQVEKRVETDAAVFAHLLDSQGTLVTQADGYPLLGMLPFWLWESGQIVRDVRHFDPVAAGEYTIRLGMWELATGEHWPAIAHPDGVVLLPIRCP